MNGQNQVREQSQLKKKKKNIKCDREKIKPVTSRQKKHDHVPFL